MRIQFEKTGNQAKLIDICQELSSDKEVGGLLILSCDDNQLDPDSMDDALKKLSLPVFGGIFPAIIHGQKKHEKGSLIIGLKETPFLYTIPELSTPMDDHDAAIDELIPEIDGTQTMIVFVDGLAKNISSLVESLFNNFGLEFNYIGGGAGSLSMQQKPCLFTNNGMVQDQAIIALLKSKSGIGVSHGWEPMAGPFQVTESDNNMIISLDFQPAFDIYKKEIQPYFDQELTSDNFFSLAKNHPFGLAKLGAEKLVRDPIAVLQDGVIQCVGEIPEGSFVHILTGSSATLIDAAQNAMQKACEQYPGNNDKKPALFIDCISRVLYLEDNFKKELKAVQRPDAPLVGALTIGEIGCSGQDYLEFYNKTSVLGIIDI